MANNTYLKKLMGASPHIEMMVRRVYRSPLLSTFFKPSKRIKKEEKVATANFKNILKYLNSIGIKKGDIVIVHSAYGSLKSTGLTPRQIIDLLLDMVGVEGTIAMPVIRKYPESPLEKDALVASVDNILFTYDVQNSKVWTGILPKTLMMRQDAYTSRFPLNTLTAVGSDAKEMMKNNLEGDLPTPNGVNSSWKYCADRNAWVISLGVDLTHSLTMIHTVEDVKKFDWPILDWYRKKKFRIIDNDFVEEKIVLERHPKWGMLHFAERKLANDLIMKGIMKTCMIDGVLVESLQSKDLIGFLDKNNSKGYPYYWVNKFLKK